MIKRRNMLVAGVAVGAAAAGWRYLELQGDSQFSEFTGAGPGARLLEFLAASALPAAMGQGWLASLDQQPEMADILQSLKQRLDLSAADLEAMIATQIMSEFSAGNVCAVDGWRLSLTECQLAGLRQLAIDRGLIEAGPGPELTSGERGDSYTEGQIAPLENWGPRHTLQGENFNEQLDGHSGLWFKIQGAPGHAKIMIDDEIAKTLVSEEVVSSGLFGDMQARILSTPGQYDIALVDPIRKIKQPIGVFEVRARPLPTRPADATAGTFCQVEDWGPRQAQAGVAVNELPDGSMGIWVRTACLPLDAQLLFADDPLPIARRPFGLTASLPVAFLGAPGRVPLSLHSPGASETLLIGHMVIK